MNNKALNKQLLESCFKGELAMVKHLLTSSELKEHANIHHQDNEGYNALMLACRYGQLSIVKYLLSSPELKEHADLNHQNKNGWNALMITVQLDYLEIVSYLLLEQTFKVDNKTMNWLKKK